MEVFEKITVQSKLLLNIAEKSRLRTSQGIAAAVYRWGGQIYKLRCQVFSGSYVTISKC